MRIISKHHENRIIARFARVISAIAIAFFLFIDISEVILSEPKIMTVDNNIIEIVATTVKIMIKK